MCARALMSCHCDGVLAFGRACCTCTLSPARGSVGAASPRAFIIHQSKLGKHTCRVSSYSNCLLSTSHPQNYHPFKRADMIGRAVSSPRDSTIFFFINHGSVQADSSIIQSWLYADRVCQPQMITIKFCFFC